MAGSLSPPAKPRRLWEAVLNTHRPTEKNDDDRADHDKQNRDGSNDRQDPARAGSQ